MITAIILAAGRSSRLNQSVPKPFLKINNKKILDYSIKTFQNNVDKIIIVTPCIDNFFQDESLFPLLINSIIPSAMKG